MSRFPFRLADLVSHWNHRNNKETQVWWRGSRAVGSRQTMSLSLMQITHAHGEIITRAAQPDCLMCSNYHVRTSRRKAETVRYGARRDYGRPHDLLSVEQSQLRGKQLAWAARRPCWHGYCGCGKVVPDGTRQPPIRRDDQTQSGFMKKVNRRPNWSVTGQGVFQRRCRPRTGALPWIRLGGSAAGRAGERWFCDGLLSSIEFIKISACCYFTTSLTRHVVKMLQARSRSNNGSTMEVDRSPLTCLIGLRYLEHLQL